MNRDMTKGRIERMKGKAKQAIGDLTDNERMRDEGEADEAVGRAREGVGRARYKVGRAVEKAGRNLKR
jgi:uncharacterized protein YjbJ (UPF0337 family)